MRSARKVGRKVAQFVLAVFVVLFGIFYLFGNNTHLVPSSQNSGSTSYSSEVPKVSGSGWGDSAPFKRAGHAHKRVFVNPSTRLDPSQVQDRRTK